MTTVIRWLATLQFQGTHPLLSTKKQNELRVLARSVIRSTWRDTNTLREPVMAYTRGPAEHMLAQRMLQLTVLYEDGGAWLTYGCIAYPTLLGGLIVNARKLRPSKCQTREEVKTAKQEIGEGVYCWLTKSLGPDLAHQFTTAYNEILKG